MEKQLQSDSGTVFYEVAGSGPAIVFLHGFMEDHSIWDEFVEQLAEKYRCICIDLPGFGKSGVFQEIHTMDFMAGKVEEVLEKEHVSKCILIGHSMGGYVSLAFAKLFSEKLSGLVLFHSQAAADTLDNKSNRDRTVQLVEKNRAGFIKAFIPSLFAEAHVENYTYEIQKLQATAGKTSSEGIIAAIKGMRDRVDHLGTLKELQIPIYFIIGKQDSKIPLEIVMQQLDLPSNSEALIMDQVGHMGFIEAKRRTLLALQHFVERNLDEIKSC